MAEARRQVARAVARVAARYLRRAGTGELNLESAGWRARDRALDEAFASGDERTALRAVEAWENGAVADLEGRTGGCAVDRERRR